MIRDKTLEVLELSIFRHNRILDSGSGAGEEGEGGVGRVAGDEVGEGFG